MHFEILRVEKKSDLGPRKKKKSFEYFLVISKRATIHHHFLKWVNFAASSSSKQKFWLVTRQRRESWGGRCLASKWDWRRGWQHAKWHSHYNYSRGRAEPRVLPTDDDGLDIRFSTYKVSHQTVDNNHWRPLSRPIKGHFLAGYHHQIRVEWWRTTQFKNQRKNVSFQFSRQKGSNNIRRFRKSRKIITNFSIFFFYFAAINWQKITKIVSFEFSRKKYSIRSQNHRNV